MAKKYQSTMVRTHHLALRHGIRFFLKSPYRKQPWDGLMVRLRLYTPYKAVIGWYRHEGRVSTKETLLGVSRVPQTLFDGWYVVVQDPRWYGWLHPYRIRGRYYLRPATPDESVFNRLEPLFHLSYLSNT